MFVTASPLRCGRWRLGGHVDGDLVEALPGDLLGAVEDGLAAASRRSQSRLPITPRVRRCR
jgi:hypothetical protein